MKFIVSFFRFLGYEKIDPYKEMDIKFDKQMIDILRNRCKRLKRLVDSYEKLAKKMLKIIDAKNKTIRNLEAKYLD